LYSGVDAKASEVWRVSERGREGGGPVAGGGVGGGGEAAPPAPGAPKDGRGRSTTARRPHLLSARPRTPHTPSPAPRSSESRGARPWRPGPTPLSPFPLPPSPFPLSLSPLFPLLYPGPHPYSRLPDPFPEHPRCAARHRQVARPVAGVTQQRPRLPFGAPALPWHAAGSHPPSPSPPAPPPAPAPQRPIPTMPGCGAASFRGLTNFCDFCRGVEPLRPCRLWRTKPP